MNDLMLFEGNEVKIIIGENGEPLFELYSTGMALGYVRPNSTGKLYPRKDRIDKTVESAEISTCVHDGHRYLTEEQLYDFMLEARTEKCKPFRKWVTSEVLPTLRKTGGYVVEGREEDFINQYFPSFSEDVKLSMVQDLLKQNKELKGKANWFNNFMCSDGLYTSTQVAKLFKLSSAQKLNKLLNEELHLIYKRGNNWLTYATTNETWFKVIVGTSGEGHSYSSLKITPLGIVEISKLLNINFNESDLKELDDN